jgi:hypothetical protein
LEIIKSEIRLLGPLTFFSSGFLARLVTIPITFFRRSLVEITADSILQETTTPVDDTIDLKRYNTHMNVLCQMWALLAPLSPAGTDTYSRLDFTLFAIATPTLMFSDLQTLRLIPPSAKPSLSSLIPFARGSPIRPPRLFGPLSTTTVLQTGLDIIESPLLSFWLYDCALRAVEGISYRIVCATVPRPDLPDRQSKIAAHKSDEGDDTIPGLWLHDGPTLLQHIQHEARHILGWFRSWKTWRKEDPTVQTIEETIRLRSRDIECEILMGPATAHRARPSESMALEIRRHAARLAWESQGQTPPEDIDAWIGLPPTQQTNSTNPLNPEELLTTAEASVGAEMANNHLHPRRLLVDSTPLDPQPDDQARGLPSLEEILNNNESTHIRPRHAPPDITSPVENSDAFWEFVLHNYPTRVHTSSDGHALMWENADSDATPPPVRRARRLTHEDDFSRSFSRSRSRNRERLDSGGKTRGLTRHRVTSLSNYPADAFAYHTSMALTTVMMFPLESLYLRALARGFLQNPATRTGAVAAAVGIGADVRRLGAWFGGEGGLVGRLRYAGAMALIWGIQMVVSAGIWGVGTTVAVWIGRNAFGWGRY